MHGQDITVVVLHGWKLTSDKYTGLRRLLENKGYEVLVPDLPGNGAEKPPDRAYTLDDYVAFVGNYLAGKQKNKAILVGHSFGGRVAIKLAAQIPELIDRLIITGTPGFSPVNPLKVRLYILLAKAGRALFELPLLNKLNNSVRKLYCKAVGAWDYYHTAGVMRETFRNIVQENLVAPMEELQCPVLLIYGEDDKIVPAWIPARMHEVINGSRLKLVAGAGHDLPYAHPEVFVEEADL